MKKIKNLLGLLLIFVCLCCSNLSVFAKDVIYLDPTLDNQFVKNILSQNIKKIDAYLSDVCKNDTNKCLYYKGITEIYKGNSKKAVECFSSALKTDIKNPYIYEFRGVAYLELEDYQKAIEDANSAIILLPNERNPYALRFIAHTRMLDNGNNNVVVKKYKYEGIDVVEKTTGNWDGMDKVLADYTKIQQLPVSNHDVFQVEFGMNVKVEPVKE